MCYLALLNCILGGLLLNHHFLKWIPSFFQYIKVVDPFPIILQIRPIFWLQVSMVSRLMLMLPFLTPSSLKQSCDFFFYTYVGYWPKATKTNWRKECLNCPFLKSKQKKNSRRVSQYSSGSTLILLSCKGSNHRKLEKQNYEESCTVYQWKE